MSERPQLAGRPVKTSAGITGFSAVADRLPDEQTTTAFKRTTQAALNFGAQLVR